MIEQNYPILEYDAHSKSLIEPRNMIQPIPDIPKQCVICFFQDVIDHLQKKHQLTEITALNSEMGRHPIYLFQNENHPITLFHPGVGAPLAVALLEEVIALGCDTFVACGGAGVLRDDLEVGYLLVPTSAIRDEGTSYHYLPPGREVPATPEVVAAIEATFKEHRIEYRLTKTWTTDAFYRETRKKVQLRCSEGCLTVEMEAAAMFAVAQYRQVRIGQILYSGDYLGCEYWDSRHWVDCWEIREQLVSLSAEVCLKLASK
jgi:uridine phosphorylase